MFLKEEYQMYELASHLVENSNFHVLLVNEQRREIWLEKSVKNKSIVIRMIHEGFDWKNHLKADIAKVFQQVKAMDRMLTGKFVEIHNIYISSHSPIDDWTKLKRPLQLNEKNPPKMKVYYLKDTESHEEIARLCTDINIDVIQIKDKDSDIEKEQAIDENRQYLIRTYEERKKEFQNIVSAGKPFLTYIFLFINIIMFLILEINGGSTDIENLVSYGAKFNPAIIDGEWWRVVSSMFLHIGVFHLVMNMFALFYLGIAVERIFGSWRFLLIYMMAGIGGSIASFAFTINVSAGASGAIFGLFGALLFFGLIHKKIFAQTMGKGIITIIAINVLIGFLVPQIDNAAHLGGLVAGFLAASIFHLPKRKKRLMQFISLIVYLLLLYSLITVGMEKNLASNSFHLIKVEENIKEEDFETAIINSTKGLENSEEFKAELLFQRSYAYIELGEYNLAKNDLEDAVDEKNKFPEAYYNLAMVYMELDEKPSAIEAIEKAYDLDPDNDDFINLYEQITDETVN